MGTKWPKEVPVLEANDICRETYYDDEGAHCLLGWWMASSLPGYPNEAATKKICNAILGAADDIGANRFNSSISQLNDNQRNPTSIIARIWNRAMAKLGYVVNNPEAKYVK